MVTPKKQRKLEVINTSVLSKYKRYLEEFTRREGFDTVPEGLMGMMDEHKSMKLRIKTLEAQIKELGVEPVPETVEIDGEDE